MNLGIHVSKSIIYPPYYSLCMYSLNWQKYTEVSGQGRLNQMPGIINGISLNFKFSEAS